MNTGLCRNPACTNAVYAQPIERYPGAGEFCPDCGELLLPSFENATPADALRAFGEPTTLEDDAPLAVPGAAPKPASRKWVPAALLAGVLLAGIGSAALFRTSQDARPSGVDTCVSPLTERTAAVITRAFGRQHAGAINLDSAGGGACDARFSASSDTRGPHVIARDAMVAIVNPQNPLTTIDARRLRDIFSGAVTDWSRAGGSSGTIVTLLAGDGTDEDRIARETLLRDAAIASSVQRLPSSAAIVRAVAGPSGRNMIAIVPFSAAPPAKVLVIGDSPAPSTVSIGDGRYRYGFAVNAEGAPHSSGGNALVQFARSDAGQAALTADGLIGRGGL